MSRTPPVTDPETPPAKARKPAVETADGETAGKGAPEEAPREVGGPKGPEPTRYGDWERKGRCIDF